MWSFRAQDGQDWTKIDWMVTLFPWHAASRRAALSLSLSRRRQANTSNSCQMVKNAPNLTFWCLNGREWIKESSGAKISSIRQHLVVLNWTGDYEKTGSAATLHFSKVRCEVQALTWRLGGHALPLWKVDCQCWAKLPTLHVGARLSHFALLNWRVAAEPVFS